MASNELTLLRFHGDRAGDIPAITPEQLFKVCDALSKLYVQIGGANQQRVTLSWTFGLPPRKGCLEFVMAHVTEASSLGQAVKSSFPSAEAMSLGVSVATLLYTAVFGGKGVVDFYNRFGAKTPVPPADDGEPLSEFKVKIAQAALNNQTTVRALKDLVTIAASTGASKVEIVVPDEPPVTIYSTDERKASSALMRVSRTGKLDQPVTKVISPKKPFVTGTFDGEPVTLFLAQLWSVGPLAVIIWASKQDAPRDGSNRDVHGRPATPEDLMKLILDEPMPFAFEDAPLGVVLVTRSAVYS